MSVHGKCDDPISYKRRAIPTVKCCHLVFYYFLKDTAIFCLELQNHFYAQHSFFPWMSISFLCYSINDQSPWSKMGQNLEKSIHFFHPCSVSKFLNSFFWESSISVLSMNPRIFHTCIESRNFSTNSAWNSWQMERILLTHYFKNRTSRPKLLLDSVITSKIH